MEMALPVQKRSQILKDLQLFCEYLCDGRNVIEITMDDLTNPQVRIINQKRSLQWGMKRPYVLYS